MKKLAVALALITGLSISTAEAHGYYRGGYGGWHGGGGIGWVAPALIGGAIGYGMARPYYAPAPVYIQPEPVYVQPPVVYTQPGVQPAPIGYHWQEMINPQTNTQQLVLVPN